MEQKINWGLLLLIGILSSSLVITSCDKGEVDERFIITYSYSNNTNRSVSIDKWFSGIESKYFLADSETIVFSIDLGGGGCYINGEVVQNSNTCFLTAADSLMITFDDDKFLLLKREDIGVRNIFNEENYQYSKNGNSELFEYEFTEEDYEAAQ